MFKNGPKNKTHISYNWKIMHAFDTVAENVPFSVGIDTCHRLDKSVLPSINRGI